MSIKNTHSDVPWALEHDGLVISELMVLKSAAGYYWGRCYMEDGDVGPYMRESDIYYTTQEQAISAKNTFPIRVCAENDTVYETGLIAHPMVSRVRGGK